jgi:hypothetical protein
MFQMGDPHPAKPGPTSKPAPRRSAAARRSAMTVHLTADERLQFESLGGEDWLREQLRQAAGRDGS